MPDRPLRILELRTVLGTGGGPEKTILLGSARTDPSRYRITVCYIRDAGDPLFHIDARANKLPIEYVEVRERHSFDPGIWPQLKAIVRSRQIDIVHAHDYKTDLLGLLLGRATGVIPLATAHGWTGHLRRERFVYYPADRWLLTRYPHVVAVSSDIRNVLIRAGAKEDRVSVVLNGIDPEAFHRRPDREADARRTFGLSHDDLVFGSIGRLEPQKDFPLLLRAFAEVRRDAPRARLVIAGEGSVRGVLEDLIRELGLGDACRLLGHVDDVSFVHHAFDVFVQSSVYEGTPNAVLEAMALETPLVATDVGGTAELARDGAEALIVRAGDRAALTQAMRDAIRDSAAARQRAERARRRVETDLSFDTRLHKIERIYDQLAAARARDRAHQATNSCASS
jgi:glycosyltransferase involved in cell wall biosynthesis